MREAPMTQEEYVASEGNNCPFCNAVETEGNHFDFYDGYAIVSVTCSKCNAEWYEEYRLSGYEAA